jgi:hypothetical protein
MDPRQYIPGIQEHHSMSLDAPDQKNEGVPPPNMDGENAMPILNKGAIDNEEFKKPKK